MKKLLFIFLLLASPVGAATLTNQWTFDAGSGTAAVDSTGGITGTLIGCNIGDCPNSTIPTWVTPGKVGNANLRFDGVSAVVKLASLPVCSGDKSFSFWFKTYGQDVNQIPFYCPDTGHDSQDAFTVGLYRINNKFMATAVAHDGNGLGAKGANNTTINTNTWYHVVVTKSTGVINSIYINAMDVTTASPVSAGNNFGLDQGDALIGATDTSGNTTGGNVEAFCNCEIDDVRIYNGVLSPSDVLSIYTGGKLYYVKPAESGGDDNNNGLSSGAAFRTIQKGLNTVAAGDNISVAPGTYYERLKPPTSGTSTLPITVTGVDLNNTIIDSSTLITAQWTSEGSGIYSIPNNSLSFDPWSLFRVVGGVSQTIQRIAEVYWLACGGAGCNSNELAYGGFPQTKNGLGILGIPDVANCLGGEDYFGGTCGIETNSPTAVRFWDGVDALFGSDGNKIYVRFRDSSNPNNYVMRAAPGPFPSYGNCSTVDACHMNRTGSPANTGTIEIDNKNYITFTGFTIRGGHHGVLIVGSDANPSVGNVIIGNNIYGGSTRVFLYGAVSNTIIQNNNIESKLIGLEGYGSAMFTPDFNCTVAASAACYNTLVNAHAYYVSKFIVGESDGYDYNVKVWGAGQIAGVRNADIGNNTILRGGAGFMETGSDTDTFLHDNTIRWHFAQGIYVPPGESLRFIAYNNLLYENGQYNVRHDNSCDGNAGPYYYIRNKFFRTSDNGHHFSYDCVGGVDAHVQVWLVNNSMSGGNECINPMSGTHDGSWWLNNICSTIRFTDVGNTGFFLPPSGHIANFYLPNANLDSNTTVVADLSGEVGGGVGTHTGTRLWTTGVIPNWQPASTAIDGGIDPSQAPYSVPKFTPGGWLGSAYDIGAVESSGAAVVSASISVSPFAIAPNGSYVISWNVLNGSGTQSISPTIGSVGSSGNQTRTDVITTTQFCITASGTGGPAVACATLTVNSTNVSASISMNPVSIIQCLASSGCPGSNINWNVINGNGTQSIDNSIGPVAASGTLNVNPNSNTTYCITAQGTGGPSVACATLTVVVPPGLGVSISWGGNFKFNKNWKIASTGSVVIPPPSTDLIYTWPFDGNLNDTTDSSSATTNGSCGYTTGHTSQAININNGDCYLTFSNQPNLINDRTITAWIRPSSTASSQVFLVFPTSASDGIAIGYFAANGTILATAQDNSSGSGKESNVTLSANTTYFITVTKSQGFIQKIYINGVDHTASATTAWGVRQNAIIGASGVVIPPIAPFSGWIDELKVYGRILSDAEVLTKFGE